MVDGAQKVMPNVRIVQSGESASKIAKEYGISLAELLSGQEEGVVREYTTKDGKKVKGFNVGAQIKVPEKANGEAESVKTQKEAVAEYEAELLKNIDVTKYKDKTEAYTVKGGDSYWKLAKHSFEQEGVKPSNEQINNRCFELRKLNDDKSLQAGMEIKVPKSGETKPVSKPKAEPVSRLEDKPEEIPESKPETKPVSKPKAEPASRLEDKPAEKQSGTSDFIKGCKSTSCKDIVYDNESKTFYRKDADGSGNYTRLDADGVLDETGKYFKIKPKSKNCEYKLKFNPDGTSDGFDDIEKDDDGKILNKTVVSNEKVIRHEEYKYRKDGTLKCINYYNPSGELIKSENVKRPKPKS